MITRHNITLILSPFYFIVCDHISLFLHVDALEITKRFNYFFYIVFNFIGILSTHLKNIHFLRNRYIFIFGITIIKIWVHEPLLLCFVRVWDFFWTRPLTLYIRYLLGSWRFFMYRLFNIISVLDTLLLI